MLFIEYALFAASAIITIYLAVSILKFLRWSYRKKRPSYDMVYLLSSLVCLLLASVIQLASIRPETGYFFLSSSIISRTVYNILNFHFIFLFSFFIIRQVEYPKITGKALALALQAMATAFFLSIPLAIKTALSGATPVFSYPEVLLQYGQVDDRSLMVVFTTFYMISLGLIAYAFKLSNRYPYKNREKTHNTIVLFLGFVFLTTMLQFSSSTVPMELLVLMSAIVIATKGFFIVKIKRILLCQSAAPKMGVRR